MSTPLAHCAELVSRLRDDVDELTVRSEALGLPAPHGEEWYELLVHKLLPQLAGGPLIVAVVGGTNTGKSVVFNHIAGHIASGISPLASGTRHPLCLVPADFNTSQLASTFEGFSLKPWSAPEDTLTEDSEHRLYWRTDQSLSENLLVLDSPDIDSDAEVNWERAQRLRQSADVLVAVLTQQKYNDAAVKQFFRQAAEEDRAVLVVFNQCLLPADEAYWPAWLKTFVDETGTEPRFVYLAPLDREAAEANRLVFLSRDPSATLQDDAPRDLQQDLSELRFEEIKYRSLRGSLRRLLDPSEGLSGWLETIRTRGDEFRSAADLLSAEHLADIDDWPSVPARLMVAQVRAWWQSQREGWSSRVHSFYNALGRGLAWPVKSLSRQLRGDTADPLETYQQAEWATMLNAVELVYKRLTWCREAGGELLGPRLAPLLDGTARQQFLEALRAAHDECDLASELRDHVAAELAMFRDENPRSFRMLRRIDRLAAATRPATSVALFVVGFGPVGHAVAPVVTDAAVQSALHVAGDLAGGTIAAALGESALSHSAATGAGYLEAKFHHLQSGFAVRRASWLGGRLQDLLLGKLSQELQAAAAVADGSSFQRTTETIEAVTRQFETCTTEPISGTS